MGDAMLRRLLSSPSTTTVMTVRNPLSRLVSAYAEKFHDGNMAPVLPSWIEYINKYCQGCQSQNGTVTFIQFLNMILKEAEEKGITNLNSHWRPYTTICSPCSIQYTYIFRQETFDEDLRYLTQFLQMKEVEIGEASNNRSASRFLPNYIDYYEGIPETLFKQIVKLYEHDFRIFDYSIPNIFPI